MNFICGLNDIGLLGELRVQSLLKTLSISKYKVINNILLRHRGRSVQIDHIVVSRHGVFVIETKNINANIWGDVNSQDWIQYYETRDYLMYNPIMQNEAHIEVLSDLLCEPKESFKSVVVFTGRGSLNISNMTQDLVDIIIKADSLIDRIIYENTSVISYDRMIELRDLIIKSNCMSIENLKRHKEYVKKLEGGCKY